ncbi:hypothetical protein H5410_028012 [Solanum commersonii]|uniref:Putative plant transposon protein domain-containing protein n=1 Tax=Solanum commersonii TaxID=4109 RepID=A0A9J5Z3K4_SOLCO|nr:hypothetical protein H5410_028012 [Solanum commersonii]
MVGNGLTVSADQSIWATNTSMRGKDVKFNPTILNEFLGPSNCDSDDFNTLKDKPAYRDIRHTLCGVESTARWERSKDTERHNTLNFANFNQVARVWLKIVCSVLLPAKHLTKVTRDRVVLVYMLMKGMPINVGEILRQNMMKFRNNIRWHFSYEGLITWFLRAWGIEEEVVDLTITFHPDLTGKLVDVTRTKALDTSHEPVLSAQERQAHDDSVMARMFGKAELQLRIRGRPITDAKMETMAERYPLSESAAFLCKIGPTFLEPLDDDEATVNEAIDDEDDGVVDKETNALMGGVVTKMIPKYSIPYLKLTLQPNENPLDSLRSIMRNHKLSHAILASSCDGVVRKQRVKFSDSVDTVGMGPSPAPICPKQMLLANDGRTCLGLVRARTGTPGSCGARCR